jgi:hypothetical protein
VKGGAKYGLIGVDSKGVAAIQALQVVEEGLVELVTEGCASLTAGNATSQTAEHSTSDTADGGPGRAKRQADRSANPSTTGRHGKPTGSAGSRANSAAYFAAILQDNNADRAARRTLNDHETSMKWGQERHSFLASWR